MNRFLGIVRFEYGMSIRRWGYWLAFGLLSIPYITEFILPAVNLPAMDNQQLWQYTGTIAFRLNLFLPVIAGIVLADRLVRDQRLGVDELLSSTPLRRPTYILGKYVGGLLSTLTPVFLLALLIGSVAAAFSGRAEILSSLLVTFLAINLPTYAFVTAFSLACPVVIPVRVYQVLFTGYWFWGNFLVPEKIPTLNGTLLTASGEFALFGFFGGWVGLAPGQKYTASEAVLNLIVLGLCVLVVLVALERFLAWRDRRA